MESVFGMKPSEIKKIEDKIRAMLRDSKLKRISRASIKKRLTKAGYSLSDIEQALNRVLPVKGGRNNRLKRFFPKICVPAFFIPDGERYRYSREAYGALIRLHTYQLLNPQDWKNLLEKLSNIRGKIYLGEVLKTLEQVVINRYPMEQVKAICDVALGSKSMYQ